MRVVLWLGLGLFVVMEAIPATAGTLANYKAKPGQYKMENGVRVFRPQTMARQRAVEWASLSAAQQQKIVQTRTQKSAKERAFERGYDAGFDAGYDKANKKRKNRKNRYNYGRRYSTSGYNPRYSRFRSNIGYGRPAYVARSRKKR